ncbi:MAG TPA: hypothetical protein VGR27_15880, partial [Longimicrobiaceae bacterium]|nr:hypothetical protein [Longimicrobiaceae bacterium]
HGEAVAIGMVLEARIGERIGVTEPGTSEALRTALGTLGLPTQVPPALGVEELLAWTRMDKKARSGRVEYALLERLGAAGAGVDATWGYAVPDEVVREVVEAG